MSMVKCANCGKEVFVCTGVTVKNVNIAVNLFGIGSQAKKNMTAQTVNTSG